MDTLTYRLDHDLGFAPNPFFGYCTLACCMSAIRQYAQVGDVIVGLAGSNKYGLGCIHPQLIYWMRVDEDMSFTEYWEDQRFERKRPRIPGPQIDMVGDCTYRRSDATEEWKFEISMHYIPQLGQYGEGHLESDTKVDRVLISRNYTYWGNSGPVLPNHLLGLFPIRRHYKRLKNNDLVSELHNLIGLSSPKGLVGDPADWVNPRYF